MPFSRGRLEEKDRLFRLLYVVVVLVVCCLLYVVVEDQGFRGSSAKAETLRIPFARAQQSLRSWVWSLKIQRRNILKNGQHFTKHEDETEKEEGVLTSTPLREGFR